MPTNINFDKKLGITGGTGISLPSSTPSYQNEYSFQFDGVDDYIQTDATYSELNGQSKASFSAWIKPTATNLLGVILHTPRNTGASDSQFQILIDNGNRLRFQVQNTGTYVFSNAGVFTANTWSHILVCYDGTLTSANRGKIFIDGVDETSAVNMNVTSFDTSIGSLYISEHSQGFWNPFSGKIDEVAIWSGTDFRTQSDVDTIYNGGIPNNLNDNGLTAPTTWFRMGEEATFDGIRDWNLVDQGTGGNDAVTQNIADTERVTDVPPNPFTNTLSTFFDGVDDYVDTSTYFGVPPIDRYNKDTFSVSVWIKVDASQTVNWQYYTPISATTNGGNVGLVTRKYGNATGHVVFSTGLSGTSVGTTQLDDGNWHHLLGVFIASTDNWRVFVDGNSTPEINQTIYSWQYFDKNVKIGQQGNQTNFFVGNVDECAYWLSDESANLATIYNSGVPNDISSLSPLSWWRCGDGDTAPTLTDNGSGGNDGTMTNFSTFSTDVPT